MTDTTEASKDGNVPIRAPKGGVAVGDRPSARSRARRLVTPWRAFCSVAVALAIGLMLIGFWESRDGEPLSRRRPNEVLNVFPGENDKLRLRQEPIGFRLIDGFTGELIVDGRQIPLDQLQGPDSAAGNGVLAGLTGLNQFSFTPGSGTAIERLEPGNHTATVTYYRKTTETVEQGRSYTWSFNVG